MNASDNNRSNGGTGIDTISITLKGQNIELVVKRRDGQLDLPLIVDLEENQQLVFCQPARFYIEDAVTQCDMESSGYSSPLKNDSINREVDGDHSGVSLVDLQSEELYSGDDDRDVTVESSTAGVSDPELVESCTTSGEPEKPVAVYQCEECDKGFSYRGGLRKHMVVHTGERRFRCDYANCDYAASYSSHLKVHKRRHTGERPFICPIDGCSYSGACSSVLKKHYTRAHVVVESGDNDFDVMLRDLMSEESYSGSADFSTAMVHMSASELSGSCITDGEVRETVVAYRCDKCAKEFSYKRGLQKHMVVHTGERRFRCDFSDCNYAASYSSHLKVHKRRHTGERPFVCPVDGCSYSAACSNVLKRHTIRMHDDATPYRCDVAGCDFSCSSFCSLTVHKQLHTAKVTSQNVKSEPIVENEIQDNSIDCSMMLGDIL